MHHCTALCEEKKRKGGGFSLAQLSNSLGFSSRGVIFLAAVSSNSSLGAYSKKLLIEKLVNAKNTLVHIHKDIKFANFTYIYIYVQLC